MGRRGREHCAPTWRGRQGRRIETATRAYQRRSKRRRLSLLGAGRQKRLPAHKRARGGAGRLYNVAYRSGSSAGTTSLGAASLLRCALNGKRRSGILRRCGGAVVAAAHCASFHARGVAAEAGDTSYICALSRRDERLRAAHAAHAAAPAALHPACGEYAWTTIFAALRRRAAATSAVGSGRQARCTCYTHLSCAALPPANGRGGGWAKTWRRRTVPTVASARDVSAARAAPGAWHAGHGAFGGVVWQHQRPDALALWKLYGVGCAGWRHITAWLAAAAGWLPRCILPRSRRAHGLASKAGDGVK